MSFIPAREKPAFSRSFAWFSRLFAKRRLHRFWLRNGYEARPDRSVLYLMNHHTWWDGLIPLLLNQFIHQQKGRAMMDIHQMHRYPFFKWLGAFSVDATDPAHVRASLRYALRWIQEPGHSLYIFPQGRIEPFTTRPSIRNGTLWLTEQCPDLDIVPVGIYLHAQWHSRPELQVAVEGPLELSPDSSREERGRMIEDHMKRLLDKMVDESMDPALYYDRWL